MSTEGEKSICILTTGCVECLMDANLLERHFQERHGLAVAESCESADYTVLLGCAFNQYSEDYTRNIMDFIRAHKKPEADFLVMGCISRIRPELATREGETSLSVKEINDVLSLGEVSDGLAVTSPYHKQDDALFSALQDKRQKEFYRYSGLEKPGLRGQLILPLYNLGFNLFNRYKNFVTRKIGAYKEDTACLRISMGCNCNCSYCAIKISRGRVRSKPIDAIVAEFRRQLDRGHSDFALLGTNIGDYGKDQKKDLLHLLEKMLAVEGDYRLRLRNLHPMWVNQHFRDFYGMLATGKFLYLHVPIQSANDRVLRAMNRGYRAGDTIENFRKINRSYPGIALKTDIMVGFPTETEAEAEDSHRLIKQHLFHQHAIMRYTDRPGTPAAEMAPKVPKDVIMAQSKRMMFSEFFSQPVRRARIIYRLNYKKYGPPLKPGVKLEPEVDSANPCEACRALAVRQMEEPLALEERQAS